MRIIVIRNVLLFIFITILLYKMFVSEVFIKGNFDTLVTGGAGFIGHHVLMKIPNAVGIDSFNNYYDVSLKYKRAKISGRVIEGNVCDMRLMTRIINKYNIKKVIHLAAQAGVRYSLENPQAYVKSNVECFVQILEVLKNTNIPLIYASSSSVYGKNTKIPFTETDPVIQPASLYAATKRENELLAHVYHNLYKQKSIGLRFFTVYGPMGRPDMAYFSFTKNILERKAIDVYNYGKVSRDFTYIDDIVDGILGCLKLDFQLHPYEILNLGRGQPYSVEEFISFIENASDITAIKKMMPMAKGDVLITYANISKAKKLVGYNPQITLEEGINKFVKWYKNEYY